MKADRQGLPLVHPSADPVTHMQIEYILICFNKDEMMNRLIELALAEDLADIGDVTSQAIFSDEENTFYLYAKDSGVLCGSAIWNEVFSAVDPDVRIEWSFSDGQQIPHGALIAVCTGKVLSILTAERTAINFLSHLSAIATRAYQYTIEATDTKAVILDTRKTLPGYRELAKYAVTCGGAQNHRQGLYDMVMIKDNHADAAGGITSAVTRVRSRWEDRFPIEVETRDLEEVREALSCGVNRIMLDNMSCDMMRQAVGIIGGRAEVEASGNMSLGRIREVAGTGVDFISVGDITHSVRAFDFSLKQTPPQ